MVGLKFVPIWNEVKLLEATTIYSRLECISSIHISNVVVESDCLEVVNLLNDVTVDFSEDSFFIVEAKEQATELGTIYFSHVYRSQKDLVHYVALKTLEDREILLLYVPYLEQFILYIL